MKSLSQALIIIASGGLGYYAYTQGHPNIATVCLIAAIVAYIG